MQTVKTIEIDGSTYLLPAGITDNKLAELAGSLLLLRRVDYCCDNEYRKTFHYPEQDSARVRIGTKQVYDTQEAAHNARDLHNGLLIEKEAIS